MVQRVDGCTDPGDIGVTEEPGASQGRQGNLENRIGISRAERAPRAAADGKEHFPER